jgi:hypothetical protein
MKYAIIIIALLSATEAYAYASCIRDYYTGKILYCL